MTKKKAMPGSSSQFLHRLVVRQPLLDEQHSQVPEILGELPLLVDAAEVDGRPGEALLAAAAAALLLLEAFPLGGAEGGEIPLLEIGAGVLADAREGVAGAGFLDHDAQARVGVFAAFARRWVDDGGFVNLDGERGVADVASLGGLL